MCEFVAIGQTSEPLHRQVGLMRPVDNVAYIRHSIPIDDRGHFGQRRAVAFAIQSRGFGNHSGGQREMTARGFAHGHDAVDVEVVGLGLRGNKTQGAQAIFDSRRSQRHARQTILHVHHVPSHFEPRDEVHLRRLFRARGPKAAMKVDHRGLRSGDTATPVNVELDLGISGGDIGHVRNHVVFIGGMNRPCGLRRQLSECGLRGQQNSDYNQPDRYHFAISRILLAKKSGASSIAPWPWPSENHQAATGNRIAHEKRRVAKQTVALTAEQHCRWSPPLRQAFQPRRDSCSPRGTRAAAWEQSEARSARWATTCIIAIRSGGT